MRMRDPPLRLFRAVMILIAVLCVAAAAPLAAQQASDSARVAGTSQAQASSPPITTLPGPRVSAPQFQRYEPSLARSNASDRSSLAVERGHTIVISTLALVLIVIIVVLLVR